MKKFRVLAALCAAFVLALSFSTVAYAGGGEETEETTETAVTETVPLTPDGNLTLVDDLSGEQGADKQFITVVTKNGNYFYMIIDRAAEDENVYLLNMVDESDLLALMEDTDSTGQSGNVSAIPETETPVETTPEPEAKSEGDTEQEAGADSGGGNGGIIVVVLIVLVAGGAGYYFKIYRPKQQQADIEEDYDYEADEVDPYGEDTEPEDEDDSPPWDEDEEYSGDEEA